MLIKIDTIIIATTIS